MTDSNFLQIAGSVAYFVGTLILFNCGDASQVSYKTLQLMFAQLMLEIPAFFLPSFSFINLIRYCFNILVIVWIVYMFNKPGSKLRETYKPELDDFPFHWLLLPLATVVPLILTFVPNSNLLTFGVCPSWAWRASEFVDSGTAAEIGWGCTLLFLWMTSLCLMPLMFLPQLRLCVKLTDDLKYNVKLFLICMMVYAAAVLFLYVFFGSPQWPIAMLFSAPTIFMLGVPVFGWHKKFCSCLNRGSGAAAPTSGGDLQMAETGGSDNNNKKTDAMEDYGLPTVSTGNSPNNNRTSNPTAAAANASSEYDAETPSWLT
jgi:hypothetical protein